jgi:hypothetical protein
MIGWKEQFAALALTIGLSPAVFAATPEFSACSIVSGDDAQKFVGGPLDVREHAKVPTGNGPGTYDSICTYIARGTDVANSLTAPRLLDLTLHVLHSAEAMSNIYQNSVEQYSQMAKAPDAPFKNATITPIDGFGDRAFVLEAVTDPKTGYKSTLIVFYKGAIGGSIAAWKKPESSLETSKAVLRYVLSRLP